MVLINFGYKAVVLTINNNIYFELCLYIKFKKKKIEFMMNVWVGICLI